MKRVFLAFELPESHRAALAVQQFLLPLPRKVAPESFHLTLVFLGETPMAVIEAVHEGWQALRLRQVSLQIQGFGLFGGARPRAAYAALVPDPALIALQAKLEQAARRAGATPEHRRFVPHVTLGRFPPPPPAEAMRLERAVAMASGFALPPFVASDMVLYESRLGASSARYEELARYPLIA